MSLMGKSRRSTGYLDAELHRALKMQATETSSNISELINEAVREDLREDRVDLAVFDEPATEPTFSFEEMLKRLDLEGKILN